MKLLIDRDSFLKSISQCMAVIKGKNHDILQCVLIQAEHAHVSLTSTNLDMSIVSLCDDTTIGRSGSVAVNAEKLKTIVTTLSSGTQFTLELIDNLVRLKSGRIKVEFPAHDANCFPSPPDVPYSKPLEIDRLNLIDVIKSVQHGLGDKIDADLLRTTILIDDKNAVATNRSNIAITPHRIEGITQKALIPNLAASLLLQVLGSSKSAQIKLSLSSGHLKIDVDGSSLSFKQANISYPDYTKVRRITNGCNVTVDRYALLSSAQRAIALSDNSYQAIRLKLSPQSHQVSVSSFSKGFSVNRSQEDIDITGEYREREIYCSARYLIASLKSQNTEMIDVVFGENTMEVSGKEQRLTLMGLVKI